jgi:tetratricopeptide (TPR) repeat protein
MDETHNPTPATGGADNTQQSSQGSTQHHDRSSSKDDALQALNAKFNKVGDDYLAEGKIDEARHSYKQAGGPNSTQHRKIGDLLLEKGEVDEAQQEYTEAGGISRGEWQHIGDKCVELGWLDGAESAYEVIEKTLTAEQYHSIFHKSLEAEKLSDAAVALEKSGMKNAEDHMQLGDAYEKKHELSAAEREYEKAKAILNK